MKKYRAYYMIYDGSDTLDGPEVWANSWEEALELVRGRLLIAPAEEDPTPKITIEDLAHYVYKLYLDDKLKLRYNWDRNTFWGAFPEQTSLDTKAYVEVSEKQIVLTTRFGGTIKIFTEYASRIFEVEAIKFNETRADQEQIDKMALAIGLEK